MTDYVEVKIPVPLHELWECVFGSGFETWGWWNVTYLYGADWDKPGSVALELLDEDGSVYASRVVNASVLGQALAKVPHIAARWSEMDSGDADVVLQTAVAGEAVFG